MWMVDWLQNGPHREPFADRGAALAEEKRLDMLGVTCKVAWFCAGWEAAA